MDPPRADKDPNDPTALKVVGLGTFPSLQFEALVIPNIENSLSSPVLLPQLDPCNRVAYDGIHEADLTLRQTDPNDSTRCLSGVEGLKMTVSAGTTVTLPGGIKVGPNNPGSATLSLNQVHHDAVPMPIPDGAAPPFTWTLQPGGATFDKPVTITYPNMSGLPAGGISYFLSFNHATGKFEIIGSGHVSTDGSTIQSDLGVGITTAGWGCNCPPYSVTGRCCHSPDQTNAAGTPLTCGCDPPCNGCKRCVAGSCVPVSTCCGGQPLIYPDDSCCFEKTPYDSHTKGCCTDPLTHSPLVYEKETFCCTDAGPIPVHPIPEEPFFSGLTHCPNRVPTTHSTQQPPLHPGPGGTWNIQYDGCSNPVGTIWACGRGSPLPALVCATDFDCHPGNCIAIHPNKSPDNPTQLIFVEADDTWFSGRRNAGTLINDSPDSPLIPFLACDTHDKCYQTCYTGNLGLQAKGACDATLFDDMLDICDNTKHGDDVRRACRLIANEMYFAVDAFGGSAFTQDQIETCDCCRTPQ